MALADNVYPYLYRYGLMNSRVNGNFTAKVKKQGFAETDHEHIARISNTYKEDRFNECKLLIEGDKSALKHAKVFMNEHRKTVLSPKDYIDQAVNCTSFKANRGYWTHPVTDQESAFPIAFGISMFRDVELTERLLRAIYRPSNFYCIHVDKKSSVEIHKAIYELSKCFSNVWLSSVTYFVKWGTITTLLAQIACMRELWNKGSWKYFITLTGQEFPLKTNLELTQILTAFNGSNDVYAQALNSMSR